MKKIKLAYGWLQVIGSIFSYRYETFLSSFLKKIPNAMTFQINNFIMTLIRKNMRSSTNLDMAKSPSGYNEHGKIFSLLS